MFHRISWSRLGLMAALLAAGVVSQNPARAQVTASARQEISAIYKKMDAVSAKNNGAAALVYVTPDCKFIYRNGMTLTREQMRSMLQQQARAMKTTLSQTRLQKFTAQNRNIIVISQTRQVMTGRMQNPQTKRAMPVKIEASATSQDLWVKTASGWRLKQSKSLQSTTKINGRVVDTGM